MSFFNLLISSLALGVFSTLLMDLSNFLAKRYHIHPGGSYALIGRWVGGFFRGQFTYSNILQTSHRKNEVLIGLVAHYLIGITLALIYLVTLSSLGLNPGNFLLALGFGLLTNILPWFVMFPAFGFGVLARKGPPGNRLLKTSFLNHLSFGIALALGMQMIL